MPSDTDCPPAIRFIGAALVGGNPRELDITGEMPQVVAEKIEGRLKDAVMSMLREAAASVCCALGIQDCHTTAYLEKLAVKLYPRLGPGVPRSVLEGMFLSFGS